MLLFTQNLLTSSTIGRDPNNLTVVTDNFNRADTGPPLGPQWTNGLFANSSGWKVVGNQAAPVGTGTYITNPVNRPAGIKVQIPVLPTGGIFTLWLASGNLATDNVTGYALRFNPGTDFILQRWDAGVTDSSATFLSGIDDNQLYPSDSLYPSDDLYPDSAPPGMWLALMADADTIEGLYSQDGIEWTSVGSVFDTTYAGNLYGGLLSTVTTTRVDNVSFGDSTGLLSVGVETTLDWSVNQTIQTNSIYDWSIRQIIAQTNTDHWSILNLVTNSNIDRFNVQSILSDPQTFHWSINNAITDNLSFHWSLLQTIPIFDTFDWTVQSSLGDTLTVDWAVNADLGKNLVGKWNISFITSFAEDFDWSIGQTVGVETTYDYSILQIIGNADSFNWNIQSSLADASIVKWNTQAILADTLTAHWAALDFSQVGVESAARWNVQAFSNSGITIDWGIVVPVLNVSTFKWNEQGVLTDELSVDWGTLSILTDALTNHWSINVSISDTTTYHWSLQQKIADTNNYRWNVQSLLDEDFIGHWSINNLIGKTNTFDWNVLVPVFDEGTFAWSITLQTLNHGYLLEITEMSQGAIFALQRWTPDGIIQLGDSVYVPTYDVNSEVGIRTTGTEVVVVEAWHKAPGSLQYSIVLQRTDETDERIIPDQSFIGLETEYADERIDDFGGGQTTFGAIQNNLTSRFNISDVVGKSEISRFNLSGIIGDTFTGEWSIIASVSDILTGRFNVMTSPYREQIARWSVNGFVSKLNTYHWTTLFALGDSSIEKWNVQSIFDKDIKIDWEVQSLVFSALGDEVTFDWTINNVISDELTFTFDLTSNISFTTRSKWNVSYIASNRLVSLYTILANSFKIITSDWAVQSTTAYGVVTFRWNITSFQASASDTFGILESVNGTLFSFAKVIDSIFLTSDVTVLMAGFGSNITIDSITIGDTANASRSITSGLGDEFSISEEVDAIKGWIALASDSIKITELIEADVVVDSDSDPDFVLQDKITITEFAEGLLGRRLILNVNLDPEEMVVTSNKKRL